MGHKDSAFWILRLKAQGLEAISCIAIFISKPFYLFHCNTMKKTFLTPQKKILAIKQTSCQILAQKRPLKTTNPNSKYFPVGHRRPVFNGYLFIYVQRTVGAVAHSSGAVHCLVAGASVRMQNTRICVPGYIWHRDLNSRLLYFCMSCLTTVLLDTSAGQGLI